MSPAAYQKRLRAIRLAGAINSIEGAPVSSAVEDLTALWARGEISGSEMKAKLMLRHRALAKQARAKHE
ncbi:hypothetical protein [Allofournierella sp.]|uniref:antitoxin VbhA family protein n=1 Tax=Allofournierella sp. TaxID=1940256 RepID=UPI003AF011CF